MASTSFFSCDWGTTHFRLRLVELDSGAVIAQERSTEGVASIARDCTPEERPARYAEVLRSHMQEIASQHPEYPATHCVISGMASSRLGWKELPYAKLPQPLSGAGLVWEKIDFDAGVDVFLISGVCSEDDVMRGEEIELFGAAALLPELKESPNALIILPGTHSKHIHIRSGVFTGFETYMTGELFSHLSKLPTLAPCLDTAQATDQQWFRRGVRDSAAEGFTKSLFGIRARNLLQDVPANCGTSYLSGLLIGSELLHATRETFSQILLASSGKLAELYQTAGAEMGLSFLKMPQENFMELATIHAHRQLLKTVFAR